MEGARKGGENFPSSSGSSGAGDFGTLPSIFNTLQTDLLTAAKPVAAMKKEAGGEDEVEESPCDVNSLSGK